MKSSGSLNLCWVYLPPKFDIKRTWLAIHCAASPANILDLLMLEVFFCLYEGLVSLKPTKQSYILDSEVQHLDITRVRLILTVRKVKRLQKVRVEKDILWTLLKRQFLKREPCVPLIVECLRNIGVLLLLVPLIGYRQVFAKVNLVKFLVEELNNS